MAVIIRNNVMMSLSCLRGGAAACATAILAATTALAQATNYTSIEATPGKSVQLSYHASVHKNTCSPAPLPTIRVTEPPHSGTLTVRRALLTTDKVAGCPHLKIPAQVIFYQARAGYAGRDHVVYEVASENEEVVVNDVTIDVKATPAPGGATGQAGKGI